MKLLLDTHIFLWFVSGDEHLPPAVVRTIREPRNQVYLSVVSIWEATIKYQLNKLPLPQPAATFLPVQRQTHRMISLSIDEGTIEFLPRLPSIHRDPFDRILICQAQQHGLTIVTADTAITAYPVATLF